MCLAVSPAQASKRAHPQGRCQGASAAASTSKSSTHLLSMCDSWEGGKDGAEGAGLSTMPFYGHEVAGDAQGAQGLSSADVMSSS